MLRCAECKHWNALRNPDGQARGECRLRAPAELQPGRTHDWGVWPETYGTDWCGEAVERPPLQD